MADVLSAYSIQTWLESCPQGYLRETVYGHPAGEREPHPLLENEILREQAIRTTVQLVVGERCVLAASSGLINAAPDEASRRFLATQTLDEARHTEIFTQRLYDLGVKSAQLEDVLETYANPHLVQFAEVLLDKVEKKDFVAGVVGQNIILEGMAFHVFELMYSGNQKVNPKFAHTLEGTIADERRHVGFGEARIGSLIREHPEKKPEIERLQRDMSYHMLATFSDSFRRGPAPRELRKAEEELSKAAGVENRGSRWQGQELADLEPEEMEKLLSETVLGEFKRRLERIGIEYQSPLGT